MTIHTVSSTSQNPNLQAPGDNHDKNSSNNESITRSFSENFGGMSGVDQSDPGQATQALLQSFREHAPEWASDANIEKLYSLLKSNEDASRKLERIMEKFIASQSAERDEGRGMDGIGEGGESWLVALAKALGKA